MKFKDWSIRSLGQSHFKSSNLTQEISHHQFIPLITKHQTPAQPQSNAWMQRSALQGLGTTRALGTEVSVREATLAPKTPNPRLTQSPS